MRAGEENVVVVFALFVDPRKLRVAELSSRSDGLEKVCALFGCLKQDWAYQLERNLAPHVPVLSAVDPSRRTHANKLLDVVTVREHLTDAEGNIFGERASSARGGRRSKGFAAQAKALPTVATGRTAVGVVGTAPVAQQCAKN